MTGVRRLLTGPAGSGKTHAALGRIRDAATETGLRGRHVRVQAQALLVLPTYAQVRHAQRIALSRWDARAMIDAPFATFTSAGERFLPRFRVRALPSTVERDRLMAAALASVAPSVFSRAGDAPGLRVRLLRLVKDLKQTGHTGDALRGRLEATLEALPVNARDRTRDFLRVFEAYERLLHDAGFEDHEDVLRRLAESLEAAHPERVPAVLVLDGFDDFTAVEHRILDALVTHVTGIGGEVLVTLPHDAARPDLFAGSAPTRARLLARGFVEEHLSDGPRFRDPALAHLASHLFGPIPGAASSSTSVRTLVAGDPEDEAECVARAVRALDRHREGEDGAIPGWRNVGIVCRDLVGQAPRIHAALHRLGVPSRILHTGPALTTVPWIAALQGPLSVLRGQTDAGQFSPRRLRSWLRWCAASREDGAARAAVDELDVRHRGGRPPRTWDVFCTRLPDALQADAAGLNAAASELTAARGAADVYGLLARWIEQLVPLPRGGGLDARGRVLDPERDARRQQAAAALRRVKRTLEGLTASAQRVGGAPDLRVDEAIQALEESWVDATLPLPDRRLDAVNLLDPHTARYWELDHVFVVGLCEGAFPLRPREDVLLRDEDRQILAAGDPTLALPTAQERETREQRLFYGAVTRARSGLWLSRPAYDRDGNPLQPSVYWDWVHAYVEPTLAHRARRPGRLAWSEAWTYTQGDLVRLAAMRVRRDPSFARAVFADAPGPARRARTHVRRAPATLTAPDTAARFARSVDNVNVSALRRARVCPYQHFAHSILRIRSDELTFEGPVFGYREEGQALHRAFELALREPDRAAASIGAACADEVEAGPAQRTLLTHELTRAVELLRERERDTRSPFVAIERGLEHTFGEVEDVWLGEGDERFRLHGRVDRVDAMDADTVVLVDYKRSKTSVKRAQSEADDEQDLQLPLYARALETSWGVRVVGLEWIAALLRDRRALWDSAAAAALAPRREGVAPVVESSDAFRTRLESAEAAAAQTVAAVRSGDHARRPIHRKACDDCAWRPLCRPDRRWLEGEGAQ